MGEITDERPDLLEEPTSVRLMIERNDLSLIREHAVGILYPKVDYDFKQLTMAHAIIDKNKELARRIIKILDRDG